MKRLASLIETCVFLSIVSSAVVASGCAPRFNLMKPAGYTEALRQKQARASSQLKKRGAGSHPKSRAALQDAKKTRRPESKEQRIEREFVDASAKFLRAYRTRYGSVRAVKTEEGPYCREGAHTVNDVKYDVSRTNSVTSPYVGTLMFTVRYSRSRALGDYTTPEDVANAPLEITEKRRWVVRFAHQKAKWAYVDADVEGSE